MTIDYITVKLNRGPNMRVDNLTAQIEDRHRIAHQPVRAGHTCSLNKGRSNQHGLPLTGVYESCDNGQVVDVYGNIARLGTNKPSQLARAGHLARNERDRDRHERPASRMDILRNYAACVVGNASPTHIMAHQQGVSSYIFTLDSQIRVSPGDTANPYTANPHTFDSMWVGDNHFDVVTNAGGTSNAYNFFYVNANHTKYRYFGEKGFDYIPWLDTPNILEKTSRYVKGFCMVSDNPRLNGWYGPINDLLNL